MPEPVFAVIPLTLELWSTGEEDLSADCLNDLHSFNRELQKKIGIAGFKPYQNNTLQFPITDDADFKMKFAGASYSVGSVLVDVDFFRRHEYRLKIDRDIIEVQQLTAEKLLKIVSEIRQIVRKL